MTKKTSKRKVAKKKEPIKFFAANFWSLMQEQDYRCALTGRELTPDNTEVELREPFRESGRTEIDNHYIIVRDVAYTARHVKEEAIVQLAAEIVQYRGKEYGYSLRRLRK
ncbi:MAG: hypothetical protein RIF32_06835 [Leptospirales bacterium]|jgi:hypothetical protein